MTTTIAQIADLLESREISHHVEKDAVFVTFGSQTIRNSGDPSVAVLAINAVSNGERVVLIIPRAFMVGPAHQAVVFETCLRLQWRFSLVRFEFDPSDGELRVSLQIPLADAELTGAQLHLAVEMLVRIAEESADHIARANLSGKVMEMDAPSVGPALDAAAKRLSQLAPEQLEQLLDVISGTEDPTDTDQGAA